jgi:hypothetical protein
MTATWFAVRLQDWRLDDVMEKFSPMKDRVAKLEAFAVPLPTNYLTR